MSDKTNENTITLLVSEESSAERLDKFLAEELGERSSREQLKRLILDGNIQVNEVQQRKPSYRIKEGDTVSIFLPDAKPIELKPETIPLEIIFEDDSLLVLNKPAGMLTHPTGREVTGTLVNALLAHCHGQLSGINGLIRPGIVHRLDRDTSGLLMVAKTDVAHRRLSEQLKAKTSRREYYAIVQGEFKADRGTVDAPIGRNPKYRDKMAIIQDGRPSITHWQLKEQIHGKFALLQLQLETGRTHQIRVHMASIGHPLLGDPLYGSGLEKLLKLETRGQLLQAFRLSFNHPVSKERLVFEIPMAETLNDALDFLRRL